MLTSLNFQNFKALRDNTIGFGDVTVLAGLNSAGKSSVIQGVLLMRSLADFIHLRGENLASPIQKFELNGAYLLSLGSAVETISKESGKEFSIILTANGNNFSTRFYLNDVASDDIYNMAVDVADRFTETSIYTNDFYYLNAERLGPRIRHWVNEKGGKLNCGYRGEYTAEVLARTKAETGEAAYDVIDAKWLDGVKLDGAQSIPKYTAQWMNFITPNADIGASEILGKIRSAMFTVNGNTPPNVGFGISYVLPIVVTGLLAKPGAIMVVENPEAHLHPKGQSNIGFFLGQMANAGVQIILETHSEHVVNGIRKAAIKLKSRRSMSVKISFFDGLNNSKSASILPIEMADNGDLSLFPKDFFDQVNQDMADLFTFGRR